jgi:hypothetical protein
MILLMNSNHFQITNKNCTEKPCIDRILNESETNPCGSGSCYLDGNSCVISCTNPSHYENKIKKIFVN